MGRTSPVSSTAEPDPSVSAALLAAEATCRSRGVQLTPIRKTVLRTLWESARPLGAYEVMQRLEAGLRRRLTPPTVYRALDFLLAQKLITKIESRNAFVPCAHPDHPHACVFFICENCGTSEEIEDSHLEQLFDRKGSSLGFRVSKRVLELQGVCASCFGETPSTSAAAIAL
jgi:Fur family transcriptional regulator, zinc uptake regulator